MTPRESSIERYFNDRVQATGGETRKLAWVGRKDAPDRFAWWASTKKHAFVELKRPGGAPRPSQLREHSRMREAGIPMHVIDTREGVDNFIKEMTYV